MVELAGGGRRAGAAEGRESDSLALADALGDASKALAGANAACACARARRPPARRGDGDGDGDGACVAGMAKPVRPLVPPDGGWGWMVVLGVAVCNATTQSLLSVFGLLFFDTLEEMGAETTGAAVISNSMVAITNFSGLVTGPVMRRFTYRQVAIAGGVLVAVGMFFTSMATQMWHLFISYSVLVGLGLGLLNPSTFVAVNAFFTRARGRAVGLSMAGTGLGQMLMPHAVRFLLDRYSFRGAVLVLSAVALHSIAGAMLFHPLRWHARPAPLPADDADAAPAPAHAAPRRGGHGRQPARAARARHREGPAREGREGVHSAGGEAWLGLLGPVGAAARPGPAVGRVHGDAAGRAGGRLHGRRQLQHAVPVLPGGVGAAARGRGAVHVADGRPRHHLAPRAAALHGPRARARAHHLPGGRARAGRHALPGGAAGAAAGAAGDVGAVRLRARRHHRQPQPGGERELQPRQAARRAGPQHGHQGHLHPHPRPLHRMAEGRYGQLHAVYARPVADRDSAHAGVAGGDLGEPAPASSPSPPERLTAAVTAALASVAPALRGPAVTAPNAHPAHAAAHPVAAPAALTQGLAPAGSQDDAHSAIAGPAVKKHDCGRNCRKCGRCVWRLEKLICAGVDGVLAASDLSF